MSPLILLQLSCKQQPDSVTYDDAASWILILSIATATVCSAQHSFYILFITCRPWLLHAMVWSISLNSLYLKLLTEAGNMTGHVTMLPMAFFLLFENAFCLSWRKQWTISFIKVQYMCFFFKQQLLDYKKTWPFGQTITISLRLLLYVVLYSHSCNPLMRIKTPTLTHVTSHINLHCIKTGNLLRQCTATDCKCVLWCTAVHCLLLCSVLG